MIYVWRASNNEILSYGSTPFVLSEGQSQDELETTMEAYAGRFTLSANKTTIVANGTDEAIVSLYSNAGLGAIDVLVNEVLISVAIVAGVGTLPPITSEAVDSIEIEPADKTVFCKAGQGSLVIMAVEA